MQRIFLFIFALLLTFGSYAQNAPKWAKKARNAVFSIVTYDHEDKILGTGNGFFVSEDGEAVSDYTLFRGAQRAIVITADGKQMPVTHILGANEMYDIIKFRIHAGKEKITTLPIDTMGMKEGDKVWLLPYSTQKNPDMQIGKVTEVVTAADRYSYYTVELPPNEKTTSCPLTNEAGEVVAIMQRPYSNSGDVPVYAIDARFPVSLSIGALTGNSMALRNVGIKKALPPTEEEALVFLYMRSSGNNPDEYLSLLNDFVEAYPNNAEGYQRRATLYVEHYRDSAHFELAEKDMAKAMQLSTNPGDVYFSMSRMVCMNALSESPVTYKDWGLGKAIGYINQAIANDSLPLYYQTKGDLCFSSRKYADAYEAYQKVNRSNMATADTWYAAALSLEQLGDSTASEQLLGLIDSAINCYAKPYPQEVAPYIWKRANVLMKVGRPREAVIAYNDYHSLMLGQVSAQFYYYREQAALAGRMNQLAMDDIVRAIELAPQNADYHAELGSLCARFNKLDEAISACLKAVELEPDYIDCYRILGVCYAQKGMKEKALEALNKAKEMGDTHADSLIKKYIK